MFANTARGLPHNIGDCTYVDLSLNSVDTESVVFSDYQCLAYM